MRRSQARKHEQPGRVRTADAVDLARSKYGHYFVDGRSFCSGSAAAGEPLASSAAVVGRATCPLCLAKLQARERRRQGSGRPEYIGARIGTKIASLRRGLESAQIRR